MDPEEDRVSPLRPPGGLGKDFGKFGTVPAIGRPSLPRTSWSENGFTPNAEALLGVGKVVARPASLAQNEVLSPLSP